MQKTLLVIFLFTGFLSAEIIEVSKSGSLYTIDRDDKKEVVFDNKTSLMWQDDKSAATTTKDWQDAISYCDNLSFAGYGDWRLPKRIELLSIADKSKYNPAIKEGFKNISSGGYWSSSPHVSGGSDAWHVDFKVGNDSWHGKSHADYVRCVRDGENR